MMVMLPGTLERALTEGPWGARISKQEGNKMSPTISEDKVFYRGQAGPARCCFFFFFLSLPQNKEIILFLCYGVREGQVRLLFSTRETFCPPLMRELSPSAEVTLDVGYTCDFFPGASPGIIFLFPVELPFVNATVTMVKERAWKRPPQVVTLCLCHSLGIQSSPISPPVRRQWLELQVSLAPTHPWVARLSGTDGDWSHTSSRAHAWSLPSAHRAQSAQMEARISLSSSSISLAIPLSIPLTGVLRQKELK